MYEKVLGIQQSKVWKALEKINEWLLSFFSVAIVGLIFAGVVVRYVFQSDIFGNEELILLSAWWLYFVGAANGSMEDSQIKAEMMDVFLTNRKVLMAIKGAAKTLETFVMVVCSFLAVNLVTLNIAKNPTTTALKIPFWVAQLAIAIGFVFMAIYTAYWAILFFLSIRGEKDEKKGAE